MPKQNQILAIEKQIKSETHNVVTEAHHASKKHQLMTGIARSYRPLNEDGEKFPPERQYVQVRADDLCRRAADAWGKLWDITATKDVANTQAVANVVVDGTVLIANAPATFLIWFEKQLVQVLTFVSALPRLDPAERWSWDEAQNCYATDTTDTAKTKKVPRPFVKAEATKEHPAQVEVVHSDELQGYWSTTKFSGALPGERIQEMRERVIKLQHAVKFAREEANKVEAEHKAIAKKVIEYVFEP